MTQCDNCPTDASLTQHNERGSGYCDNCGARLEGTPQQTCCDGRGCPECNPKPPQNINGEAANPAAANTKEARHAQDEVLASGDAANPHPTSGAVHETGTPTLGTTPGEPEAAGSTEVRDANGRDAGIGVPPLSILPVLPMLPEHTAWILAGTKTSTLRTRNIGTTVKKRGYRDRELPKRYCLQVDNVTVAVVEILALNTIRWTHLDDKAQAEIAKYEGYPNRDAFVEIMIELSRRRHFRFLTDFMSGRRELWLHSIKVTEWNPTACAALRLVVAGSHGVDDAS